MEISKFRIKKYNKNKLQSKNAYKPALSRREPLHDSWQGLGRRCGALVVAAEVNYVRFERCVKK